MRRLWLFSFNRFCGFELATKFRMYGPRPMEFHCGAGKNLCLMNRYRFFLMGIGKGQNTQNGPSIIRIVVCDPIHNTTDGFGDCSWTMDLLIFHMRVSMS